MEIGHEWNPIRSVITQEINQKTVIASEQAYLCEFARGGAAIPQWEWKHDLSYGGVSLSISLNLKLAPVH